MNQKGIASLALLAMIVLGIFILWEISEYITNYVAPPRPLSSSSGSTGNTQPICLSGEEGNCNDSNDVFLLTE